MAGALGPPRCRQRHIGPRGVDENVALDRAIGWARIGLGETCAAIARQQNAAIRGTRVDHLIRDRVASHFAADLLRERLQLRRFGGRRRIVDRLPDRGAGREFDRPHAVDRDTRAGGSLLGRGQNPLHGKIRQEPDSSLPRRARHPSSAKPQKSLATTIWSRLAGEIGHAVLTVTDHRIGLESREVFPGTAAIVGAEQLAAQGIDAAAETAADHPSARFRNSRNGWRRHESRWLHHGRARLPDLVIGGFEHFAAERVRAYSTPPSPENQTFSTGPVAGDAKRSSTAELPTRRQLEDCAAASPANANIRMALRNGLRSVPL